MPQPKDEFYERQYQFKALSTEREMVDFLRSAIYADFCALCKARKDLVSQELLSALTLEDVRRLQGEMRGILFWEEFPKTLLASIVEDKEDATPTS